MPRKNWNEKNASLLARTLNYLISSQEKLTPTSLARKLGIPVNKITRILNGDVMDPKASTLVQIADSLGVSINQLLGLEPLPAAYGEIKYFPSLCKLLPLFDMQQIKLNTLTKDCYSWAASKEEGSFIAVKVDNNFYEMKFPQNCTLVVNTSNITKNEDFILVEEVLGEVKIKKYVKEANKIYLYPISANDTIEEFNALNHKILGFIVEAHQKLN